MGKHIRNSTKAVILRDNAVLVIRKMVGDAGYAVLPGGGQNKDEILTDALKRECLEEIGCEVNVGELLFVREYLSDHHEFANEDPHIHQVEFFFACAAPADYIPMHGSAPDPGQVEVCWADVAALDAIGLYPKALRSLLRDLSQQPHPIYLGDVN